MESITWWSLSSSSFILPPDRFIYKVFHLFDTPVLLVRLPSYSPFYTLSLNWCSTPIVSFILESSILFFGNIWWNFLFGLTTPFYCHLVCKTISFFVFYNAWFYLILLDTLSPPIFSTSFVKGSVFCFVWITLLRETWASFNPGSSSFWCCLEYY